MAKLSLENIVKSYGSTTVIPDLNLEIEAGEFVVLVGPSGCGKSTLLRMIAGLDTLTAGDVRIDGTSVNNLEPSKRGIAMVFQTYALYPHMTVAENIGFSLRMAGWDKARIAETVAETARTLKLHELLDRRPKDLSGGQRQRVAIGRAIVRNPKVFLFDEPLSNLDAELRQEMRVEISRLHERLDATMIYVTHDQIEAMTLADRIAVLRAGKIEQYGTPRELFSTPVNVFVAQFIGSPKMNLINATVVSNENGSGVARFDSEEGGTVAFTGSSTAQPGQKVLLGTRPQHITVDAAGDFSMRADIVEGIGTETSIVGTFQGTGPFIISAPGDVEVKPHDTVTFTFDSSQLLVFDAETQMRLP